ncbi:MAG TPA: pseudaminic acid cytidylyltransferase [Elusimicrobiales bacterium]|nr:pseudaminic acid cytidylyltransferase [Elusimicrobiales bacterium]
MKNGTLAIIPARGGSKRIPRKNVRPFLGVPVIKYSIDAAMASGCFEEIMVSTDDERTAALVRKLKAKVPFMRSARNSGDLSTTADVIREVLEEYAKRGRTFSRACCIYPAAPFVTAARLKAGYALLRRRSAGTVATVVRFDHPIQRAFRIKDGRLSMFWPGNRDSRSQDLEPAYHDAGQFYWFDVKKFLSAGALFGGDVVPLEIPATEVQDLDTETDWAVAEIKLERLKKTTCRQRRRKAANK